MVDIKGRNFQLWGYRVSHGLLLIRSPADIIHNNNIDILFHGVRFICAPRNLGEISFSVAEDEDLKKVENISGEFVDINMLFVLCGRKGNNYIVASSYDISVNEEDIFFNPLEEYMKN